MTKELTIKIINELLFILGVNKQELAESLGLDRQKIYSLLNPKTATKINKEFADLVCDKFADINRDYLLTGEGIIKNVNLMNTETDKQVIELALSNIAKSLLNNSEANKDNAKANLLTSEAFNRLTLSMERVIDLLEKKL